MLITRNGNRWAEAHRMARNKKYKQITNGKYDKNPMKEGKTKARD